MEGKLALAVLHRLEQALEVKNDTDLADKLGISRRAVSAAKSGDRVPDTWVRRAAERYNLDVDWLLWGRGQEPANVTAARTALRSAEGGLPPRRSQFLPSLGARNLVARQAMVTQTMSVPGCPGCVLLEQALKNEQQARQDAAAEVCRLQDELRRQYLELERLRRECEQLQARVASQTSGKTSRKTSGKASDKEPGKKSGQSGKTSGKAAGQEGKTSGKKSEKASAKASGQEGK